MRSHLCIRCSQNDPQEFYGVCKNLCKICYAKRVKENRNKKIEYYQEYDRKRANKPERIALRKKVAERWKKDPKLRKRNAQIKREWANKNTIKRAAHIITGNAIRDGILIPELCKVCGKKKVDAHHEDYTKPLDVMWLCKKHHAELHKRKREEQRLSEKELIGE